MIFVDESIQDSLGYICVGFAYCEEDPAELVNGAIKEVGLKPGIDEYKSGYRMANSQPRHELRNQVYQIVLQQCKIGVYIAPTSERPELRRSVAAIAQQVTHKNGLRRPQPVLLDQGILGRTPLLADVVIVPDCDSKIHPGIQLADFIAYHCSYLLKCTLSGTSKKVLISEEPHPLSGEEVDLDWMVRTDLRRNFFVEYRNVEEIQGDDWFFNARDYGAFFSPSLDPSLLSAAIETFSDFYFGCVW
jgi:hypothetical protein